jgi:arginyl-tRNA synthetase
MEFKVTDVFRGKIVQQLHKFLGLSHDEVFKLVDKKSGNIQFSFVTSRLKLSPEVIKSILDEYVCDDYITNVEQKGIHINFTLNWVKWAALCIPQVITASSTYGSNENKWGEMVLVEYSSPNIAKLFHAGHLRSTIIGNFIKNVYKANGAITVGINYLGDWGKQYGLLAIGYKKYGDDTELEKDAIRHLFDVYVKICADAEKDETVHDRAREYFKALEEKEPEATKLWQRFREMSIKKYAEIYKRLNIEFDVYDGESMVSPEDISEVMKRLDEKGLLVKDKGALVVPLEEYKLGKAIVEKSDGTTIYLARDMGAAVARERDYRFNKMYYVVAAAQDHHFKQLFKIMKLGGYDMADRCEHVNFGMVKGMSTRRGNVVFLEDILNTTRDKMHEVMEKNKEKYEKIEKPWEVAEKVGISAIFVQDMAAKRVKDYEFNWDRMLSFEGDTGPYLQYAHSRLCSVARESGIDPAKIDLSTVDYSLLVETEAKVILSIIADYPQLVEYAAETLEPSLVVHYALSLSRAIAKAWQNMWVMNQEAELAKARAAMYGAARITLGNALRLIGLEPLERM